MKTFAEIAGTYTFKSPYHKNKKLLPFNIESDGYVTTIEYKGWQANIVQGFYKLEALQQLIESGYITAGQAKFPKYKTSSFWDA